MEAACEKRSEEWKEIREARSGVSLSHRKVLIIADTNFTRIGAKIRLALSKFIFITRIENSTLKTIYKGTDRWLAAAAAREVHFFTVTISQYSVPIFFLPPEKVSSPSVL